MSVLETILSRPSRGPVAAATPEWPELDGRLAVRRLSPRERPECLAAARRAGAAGADSFPAFIAAYCTVLNEPVGPGAEPQRAFADEEWSSLADDPGSIAPVDRLFELADQLNVLSDAAREELKKKLRAAPELREHCRLGRLLGVPLAELYERWGAELPVWEASLELDPPPEDALENAAWQLARAIRTKATMNESEFHLTYRDRGEPAAQSPAEMLATAEKIERLWPNGDTRAESRRRGKKTAV